MKDLINVKNIVIVLVGIIVLAIVGGTMVYSDRPVNEASYIALINRNDRDIKNVDRVDIDVVKVERIKPIGWIVYGKAGGAWVSSAKPSITKDNTLVARPQSYRYVFDRWVIIYTFTRQPRR